MSYVVQGAGLGLRRGLVGPLKVYEQEVGPLERVIDFFEVAPENWIGVGGRFGRQLHSFTDRFPFLCHGLSLSVGGPAPLDMDFVREVKDFLDEYKIAAYSEHLSYCSDEQGHLYDLLPIPFTTDAVNYVAERILRIQDVLQRRLIIENVSFYAAPGQEMEEIDFINAILAKADCELLLDVNNIYVNSVNFRYDPLNFLQKLDTSRTAYIHIAGHYREAEDLRVDTHGSAVEEDVWQLLDAALSMLPGVPVLLERDFNFPPVVELVDELMRVRGAQQAAAA